MATKNKYTVEQFIALTRNYIVFQYSVSRVLPSLTMAQAIIESKYGNSAPGNNLFGMKGRYNGQSQLLKTKEWDTKQKKYIEVMAEFRKYPTWDHSISDHAWLFCRLSRYKNLIGCKDYKQACKNVHADGYATSPTYADTLIKTIEKYELYKLDQEAFKLYG